MNVKEGKFVYVTLVSDKGIFLTINVTFERKNENPVRGELVSFFRDKTFPDPGVPDSYIVKANAESVYQKWNFNR